LEERVWGLSQFHPDAATQRRIGESFARRSFTADGPFAAAFSPVRVV